jgi:hypothetical protein
MSHPSFWTKGLIQGGGLGVYGDLVNLLFTSSGRNPFVEFAGAVAASGGNFLPIPARAHVARQNEDAIPPTIDDPLGRERAVHR